MRAATLIALLCTTSAGAVVAAEEKFPARPIRMLIPEIGLKPQ